LYRTQTLFLREAVELFERHECGLETVLILLAQVQRMELATSFYVRMRLSRRKPHRGTPVS
jgi:hypothetical protein